MADPDYILDISSLKQADGGEVGAGPEACRAGGRPWVAIHWKCCGVYSRVYRNREGSAYEGRCPRCGAATRLFIGPGGTSSRFFTAQ